ncbi:MAG: hypothetical protein AB7D36_05585 [Oscillospiraceae bacterium]
MNRKTYIDNNGFIRYEDTCKLVPGQTGNEEIISELYRIFKPAKAATISGDYEGRILARQERD